jgi:hypothetical protein
MDKNRGRHQEYEVATTDGLKFSEMKDGSLYVFSTDPSSCFADPKNVDDAVNGRMGISLLINI